MYEENYMQKKRFTLAIDSVKDTLANDRYEVYADIGAETIEDIIYELGYFISEIIIYHPEVVYTELENEEVKYLRAQEVGFKESIAATSVCTKYKVGDLIDAYIKKLVVDAIPCVEGFWIGENSEDEENYYDE